MSSGEAITCADIGSVLAFDVTAAMGGTIFGFAPSDTIDLTDVAYSPRGSVSLTANNVLVVNENDSRGMFQNAREFQALYPGCPGQARA